MKKKRVQQPIWWIAIWAGGTLIFVVIALCCILGLLHKVSQRQLILFSQGVVESSAQSADEVSVAVKDILDSISLDPDLSKLLNYESIPSNDLLRGLQQLKMYRETNYLVDSIYIYNYMNGNVYVSSPNAIEAVYTLHSFYDHSAAELLRNYQSYKNMHPVFRSFVSTYPLVETIPMMSYLRYNTLAPVGESYVVIINIREEVLYEQLNTVSEDMDTVLLLANENDCIKIINDDTDVGVPTDVSKSVLQQDSKEGYFVDGGFRSGHIICYRPVLSDNWILISVSDGSSLNSLFRNNEYILSLLLLVLLFGCCCVGAIAVIKKLGEVISANRKQLMQVEAERREKAYENKRHAIRTFLHSTGREEECVILLQKMGYAINKDVDSVIVVLVLEQYTTRIAEHYVTIGDRNSLKFGICNIAEELLDEFGVSFSSYEDDARCVVLLQSVLNCETLTFKLQEIQRCVADGLGVSLSVFVSAKFRFQQTAQVYEMLSNALPYRQLIGPAKIITSEMIDAREAEEVEVAVGCLKQMSQEILQMDIPKALRCLRETLEYISQGSYKSFQVNLVQIVVCIDDALTKLQMNHGVEKAVHVGTLIHSINGLDSIEEIYSCMEVVLLQTEERIVRNNNGNQYKLIGQIQDMVHSEYSNRDFSINTIAEKENMSAAYLSRLFKKKTGVTFVEYVLSVRMEVARRLLAETDMAIDEVVSAVGFNDVPYFYKTFKKVNGCTPAIYRKNHQRNR